MALDSKMVVALYSKFRKSVTGFKKSLGKRNAGWNSTPVHLLYGKGSELIYVYFLRGLFFLCNH